MNELHVIGVFGLYEVAVGAMHATAKGPTRRYLAMERSYRPHQAQIGVDSSESAKRVSGACLDDDDVVRRRDVFCAGRGDISGVWQCRGES